MRRISAGWGIAAGIYLPKKMAHNCQMVNDVRMPTGGTRVLTNYEVKMDTTVWPSADFSLFEELQ